ncbi:hypothetical protein QE152_g25242 [Popillia japonica]|uniref:Uncharacterized protein n=1 Tax=Popillia japonica TaxID=7064 RepID=A0AAW1K286_POPJA
MDHRSSTYNTRSLAKTRLATENPDRIDGLNTSESSRKIEEIHLKKKPSVIKVEKLRRITDKEYVLRYVLLHDPQHTQTAYIDQPIIQKQVHTIVKHTVVTRTTSIVLHQYR